MFDKNKGVTPGWLINWHLESFASKRHLSKSVSGKTHHLLNIPPQKANPNPFHFKHLSSFHGDSWWSPGNLGRKKNWGEAKDAQNVLPGFICPDVRSYYLKKECLHRCGDVIASRFLGQKTVNLRTEDPWPVKKAIWIKDLQFLERFFFSEVEFGNSSKLRMSRMSRISSLGCCRWGNPLFQANLDWWNILIWPDEVIGVQNSDHWDQLLYQSLHLNEGLHYPGVWVPNLFVRRLQ